MRRAAIMGLSVAWFVGCVDPGSKNLDPELYKVIVEPGKTTTWAAPDDGPLAGLELTFGPRAVDGDAELEVYWLESTQSPVEGLTVSGSGLRYRLIAPAFGLKPQGILFFEKDAHVRVAAPIVRAERDAWRFLSAPSVEAVRAGLWQSESTITAETSSELFIGTLSQTQEYWPVELTTPTSPTNFSAVTGVTEYAVCLQPVDNAAYPSLEEPERENECVADADCVRSGCGMEVCSPGIVASVCAPSDPKCGDCLCFSGTCRWVE